MSGLKQTFERRFSNELKQKQAITDSLINKILYSKRLLVDHVEALEQAMMHIEQPAGVIEDQIDSSAVGGNNNNNDNKSILSKAFSGEVFTAKNTCLVLGGTLIQHFATPKSLKLTLIPSVLFTTGFGAMYFVKKVFVFRNKIVERELDGLIKSIDEFGNCIRRNMTYFNEILAMKQQELIESRQIERAWDCITAAKEVTEILYDATRKLEKDYPIVDKFSQYYSPMEELRECEYFKNNVTDYNPKHIKDFHNIFAYVQSQYLLRLALTIATKPSISTLNAELVKIECLIRQLVQEEENHFRNMAVEENKKKQIELESLNAARAMQNRSGPIAVLQDSSLRLSGRMVAVAGECQALDITLQRLTETEAEHKDNAKQLVEVANNMRTIENALSICFDDFQRLMLVYNKFLNSKLLADDAAHEKPDTQITPTDDNEFPESYLRIEISQGNNDANQRDDFYAYMYDEEQTKHEQQQQSEADAGNPDREILNFEKRITRGKFRPVLKQLRDRIDPIRKDMLEKERQVLAAKGINVDELFNQTEPYKMSEELANKSDHSDYSDTDSAGSADLEFEKRSKKLKERDNFAEMRNFLAQKQAVNIFGLDNAAKAMPPPPLQAAVTGEEEILESEC